MNKIFGLLFISALLFATVPPARTAAQTPSCNALAPEAKTQAKQLFAAMHPYDGCDQTFDRCLAKKPPHPVVLRLADDICRQIKAGKSRKTIERAMDKRAQSMLSFGKKAKIALDRTTQVGNTQAPVTVVIYACARCPYCRILIPALYNAVVDGVLKDKVQLYFRPFPLKYHEGSLEGGLAMVSAAKLGKFWPFLLHLYRKYDVFCPHAMTDWASSIGIDRAAFEKEYHKSETRKELVASKQEGIRNKVKATPTVFINGRKYVYTLTDKAVIDALLEEYERVSTLKKR
jgi:protein-disulfide isomerase